MKTSRRRAWTALALAPMGSAAALAAATGGARAQAASAAAPAPAGASAGTGGEPVAAALPAFAVEIKTGPGWDTRKPPQEQAMFREHSAHLRRLREAGQIQLGARYADKGLLVVVAADLAAVKALFDADPSMKAGTFIYEAHPLSVFYGGCVQPPPRRG